MNMKDNPFSHLPDWLRVMSESIGMSMASSDLPVLFIGQKNYSSWSMRPWLLLKEAGFEFAESSVELEGRGTAG